MANRIPRAAKRLRGTWKIGNNACPAGTTVEAWREDNGWHEEIDGKYYHVFPSMLRNSDLCDIEVIG